MDCLRGHQQYAQIGEEGSMETDNHQGPHEPWVSTQYGSYQDASAKETFELRDRMVTSRTLASAFAEELPSASQPQYTALEYENDYSNSRGLAEDHIGPGKVNTNYSPLFTRRWILFCFAILWVLILVSIQILYSISQSGKGLATTNNSLKYLWTYGPTAILVLITVVWRQVDYAAKYVQPWAELAHGPATAQRSLLLDYVTPFQIVSFWKAIKYRHVTIACTILIFVLIKALTVISTGLLTSEFIAFDTEAHQMRALKQFEGTGGLPLTEVDSRAAIALYGHQTYGMLLPNGTTLEYAYQPFEPDGNVPGDVVGYNASVDIFRADGWECETGQLTYNLSRDLQIVDSTNISEITPLSGYYNTTVRLPGCDIYNGHLDAPFGPRVTNDTHTEWGYWGIFQNVNCSNLPDDDPTKQRFMISVAYSVGYGFNNQTILNSSNIVCRPSYSVQPGYVSMLTNGTLRGDVVFHGEKRELNGLDTDSLARAIYRTTGQAALESAITGPANVQIDGFLNQMVMVTPDFKVEMLLDTEWLNRTSRIAYQQLGAQIAKIYLLENPSGTSTFEGLIARNELRLVVKNLPTRLMEACTAVMLIATLVMLLTMPQKVVPRSVESVAAIAVILARSPSLVQLLRNTGHLNNRALTEALEKHRYMSTVADAPHGKTFSIRVISDVEPVIQSKEHKDIKWTRPFVLRRMAMILTLVLAVCILITLEVLYRYSNAYRGIADVDVESLQKYAWLYTPVVVLVLLAATFNVLDFELEFLDPYSQLARGYSSADRTLLWDPLRNISLKTSFQALQRSRYALMASSISVCFAPMLTIAVSGLFSAEVVSQTLQVTPQVQSSFNITPYEGYDVGPFNVPSLILLGNMSYPQWTYDELAFPAIDLSTQSTTVKNATGGTFALEIAAARASVNCSVVQEDKIFNITFGNEDYSCTDCVYYNISVPDGCGNSGFMDSGMVYQTGTTNTPTSGSGYFGEFISTPGLTYNTDTNATVNCASFMALYGNVVDRKLSNAAMHQCWTGLEIVQTNSTIDANLATVVDVTKVTGNPALFNGFWVPSSSTGNAYPYMQMVNYTEQTDVMFDPFVNTMVFGKDGVPKEALVDNKTFEDQFTHTYRQWAAQYIHLHSRQTIDELRENTTNIAGTLQTQASGTFTKPDRHRLILNRVSTRLLQGVIGVLLLCGLVIFVLVDMRKVLPKEVGTIGAVASLLAGSRLVDEKSGLIPYGSEWRSDNELMQSGVWKGQMFRMGWWPADQKSYDYDVADTAYSGAAGHVYNSLDELAKDAGEFGIDARPDVDHAVIR